MDYLHNVYSLLRYVGLQKRDVEAVLGNPEQLPTVDETKHRIRHIFNHDLLNHIDTLKKQQELEKLPLEEKKALLVFIQKAERKELADQQRVKRSLVAKAAQDRFRKGIVRVFDKIIGRERTVRRINQKETEKLRRKQRKSRQLLILRQNRERRELQSEIVELREKHQQERRELAKRIYEIRQAQQPELNKTISKELVENSISAKKQSQPEARAISSKRRQYSSKGMTPS